MGSRAEAWTVVAGARSGRVAGWFRVGLPAVVLLGLAVVYVVQLLGVLFAHQGPVLVGAFLGVLLEVALLGRRCRGVARRLGRVQFSRPVRQLLRDALFLGGLLRLDVLHPPGAGAWLLTALLACWAAHFLCLAVAGRVRRSRRLPFVTRNIDTAGLGLSDAPHRLLAGQGAARLTGVAVVTTAGMCLTAVSGNAWWGAAAATVCAVAVCAGAVVLALRLLPSRRPVPEHEALRWLDEWLTGYSPTVGLYFSGGANSAYQADMWLSTLARLHGRPLIVLRERFMVQKLGATDVPVLCIPKVAHLMQLEHAGPAVLLHPANSGKTSQVLRIPTIKHAFINHGESDKLSSCNPYAKAYDEVWVAGPAARERYAQARVGVADADVVEVGRPQLAPVRPSAGPAPSRGGTYTTVLYAPTWEGWTDDPGNTSVVLAGERLVRALLADDRVRLLYKPHPMTGSVDPAAGAADRRIRELIAEATPAGQQDEAAAGAELRRCEAELAALAAGSFRPGADEAERMLRQPAPPAGRAARVARAAAAWEEAYWNSVPAGQHRVITGPRPALYSCFNQADLLVSDVSSVVSDWLASEKPYAVVNTSGLDESRFRTVFPTVGAATVLTPAADGVPQLLAAVREPALDTRAADRARLRTRLLGPPEPPSLERFDQAALALRAAAEAHPSRVRQEGDVGRWEEARADAEADSAADAEAGSEARADALDDGLDDTPEGAPGDADVGARKAGPGQGTAFGGDEVP